MDKFVPDVDARSILDDGRSSRLGRVSAVRVAPPGASMTQRPSAPQDLERWSAVDRYFEGLLDPPDAILESVLSDSAAAGLPSIQVSPLQGRFLHLLAKLVGARRILEIGTLGGYSTIWLARALPSDGRLVTLESDPKHARVARSNLEKAGLGHRVDLQEGPALASLPRISEKGESPFDLVFIDSDKPSYPEYLDWAVRLGRKGTLIVADNVVRRGDVVDTSSHDPNVQAVRRMIEQMSRNPRLRSTVIQTVGVKGHDGFAIALVD